MITVAYDPVLKRPGCAFVQVALGASIGNEDLSRMDGWLTSPTPDMRLFPLANREQVETLIAITNLANPS